jgi:hypothetical protein
MKPDTVDMIVSNNQTYELAFQLFTSGSYSNGNQYLASDSQNIYCTEYPLYSVQ